MKSSESMRVVKKSDVVTENVRRNERFVNVVPFCTVVFRSRDFESSQGR